MLHPPIVFKGTPFTLTVIYLHHHDVAVIRAALQEKMRQAPAFLHQAPVVLNMAALFVTDLSATGSSATKSSVEIDWLALIQVVTEAGLRIVGVSGCYQDQQKQAITAAGLPVLTEGKTTPYTTTVAGNSRLVTQPIRSGQQLYASNGDMIVTSQISAGAEVIADGHLHLYGTLRGRAIAGAGGAMNSRIFCTNLQAELIAIAGQYWLSEQIPRRFWQRAVTICLQGKQLNIELLD